MKAMQRERELEVEERVPNRKREKNCVQKRKPNKEIRNKRREREEVKRKRCEARM